MACPVEIVTPRRMINGDAASRAVHPRRSVELTRRRYTSPSDARRAYSAHAAASHAAWTRDPGTGRISVEPAGLGGWPSASGADVHPTAAHFRAGAPNRSPAIPATGDESTCR